MAQGRTLRFGCVGQIVCPRRFDSSGSALTGEITISSTGSGTLGPKTSVTALANGAFVVSWVETVGGADRVLARAYDSANNAITSVFQVTQTNSGDHALTPDGAAMLVAGTVVFAWDGPGSGQDIVMRRFSISASIDGTSGNDTLNGTAGDDVMNGLAGNDLLFAQQGGNDSVNGGDGNDGIYFGGAMTNADAADGGSGIDTLALQGIYAGLTLGSGIVGIEVLLVLPGDNTAFGYLSGIPTDYVITTVDANVASGTMLTVQATELDSGEDLTFNGSAETNGSFRIFAGKSVDTLTGGAGSDGFFFGADGNLTGADNLAGGGGTDSIALRGNYIGGTAVVFQNGSFSSIEVVTFLSGHTNEFGGVIDTNGFDYDVTFANGNIPSGVRLDVIATNLRSNESARVDASAELDGSVRILSGAGDDILIGSANADFLYGGFGVDTINGGGGADTYSYRATGESTSASRDTVTFVTGDIFDLSVIDAISSTGPNDAFTFIGSSAFSNTAGQLRAFLSGAGQWTIEADVNGDSSADLVITVSTSNSLGSGDFIL